MKLLAIVPDPASAYGLGALLEALPPGTTRVVAYGQATAAVLPPGLDLFVYPVRDGSRLPAPFIEALIEHEAADVLLAPIGSVTSTPCPTLLVDLDPRVASPALVSGEDPASWTWVEGITALPDRRPTLLRAGLFSVDVLGDWFEGPGRLRAAAAPALLSRMTDLAGLLGRHRESERRAAAPVASAPPASPCRATSLDEDLGSLEVSFGQSEAGREILPAVKSIFSPPRIVPIEVRSAAAPGPGTASAGTPTALAESEASRAPSGLGPVFAPPLPATSQPPEAYRGRHAGGRALVLASSRGLDQVPSALLAEAVVLSVPETLPRLAERAGPALYVCVATPPRAPAAAASLAAARAVVVHDERLNADELAPGSAATTVPLLNLQRAGGPALGWSDDLRVGFFPAGGDAALALQWAHWLGVSEVILAGTDAADPKPGWLPFLRGARELLESRGVTVTVLEPGTR